MKILERRAWWYAASATLVAASIIALAAFGLRLGIDFVGGSLLEVEFTAARPDADALRAVLASAGIESAVIQPTGERGYILRFRHIDEATHVAARAGLAALAEGHASGLVEHRFDTVGPTIGRELARRSVIAIILVLLLIVAYVGFAFRKVSEPVASWKYGVVTVIALAHDVIIPTGAAAVAGRLGGVEVDTLFVTALLTILGFSVHDTIVVFDRVRENLKNRASKATFEAIVGQSIQETLTRSVNTSLTVILALAAVAAFGGESTRIFSITLILGIAIGTYSSICLANPLLVSWFHRQARAATQGGEPQAPTE